MVYSAVNLKRLKDSIENSRKEMDEFYKNRLAVYREFVGRHYKNGTANRVPLPMLSLSVQTILRKLVSSEPQALVTTRMSQQRASAYAFELGINRVMRDMDFGRTLKTWSMEALMSPIGIIKVALDVSEQTDFDGMPVWAGMPTASPVTFDDWVHDMSARRLDRAGFYGNRYSVVKDWALNGGVFDPDVVERIAPKDKLDDYTTQQLSRDQGKFNEDYRDVIEVWDIWLPDEGQVVTISTEHTDLPPLRVVDWDGPIGGPYHFLWFDEVPGNTLPLPPVSLWRDIHELANLLFNKLARQAKRQKNLLVVRNDSIKDGKLQVEGEDGEALVAENPEGVQEVRRGGVDNSNLGFVLQLGQLHNKFSGNPEGVAGLGPQSGTLGQDKLLSDAANERIASQQEMVDKAVTGAMRAIAFYMLQNPIAEVPIVKQDAGVEIESSWSPDVMEGDLADYEIDLVPHSLRRKTPEERMARVEQFMGSIMALAPAAQAQGIMPNVEAYVKLMSRMSNMPELNDLVIYTQGQMMESDDSIQMPEAFKKPNQRQAQVRTSKTPMGQETDMIQQLLADTE